MRVSVYTAIFDDFDSLISQDVIGEFVCFTEKACQAPPWEVRIVERTQHSGRRENRLYKTLSHIYLPETDYSLYVDGNIKLLAKPEEIVALYLRDNPVALFKHPWRRCLYDEGYACAKGRVDDPELIHDQLDRYRSEGYPEKSGLAAGTIIIRKHTPEIARFNELWWEEISKGSERDQISLNYALWKVGLDYDEIAPPWPGVGKHPHFAYYGHGGHG